MKEKANMKSKIIVTGGGSGGHVSCASAIIEELATRYNLTEENFLYIGGDLGMEGENKSESLEKRYFNNKQFNQKYIRAGKLQRKISLQTIKLLLRTILGIIDSYKIIKIFKPDIVISTGGFVTVPVCTVAKLFKAQIYIHEQTATIGLSNKIVSKFAQKVFITFPSSSKYFSKEKSTHTGNLIRKAIFEKTGKGEFSNILKDMIKEKNNYPIIYISGGGLGSHIINQTVESSLTELLEKYQIVLQTGGNSILNDYENIMKQREKLPEQIKKRFLPIKFISEKEIGFLFNNTDLFIGRAGANTVYELGVLRIPSILIPIPWVTHNEQEENARILSNLGIAKIINEKDLTPQNLSKSIDKYFANPTETKNKIKLNQKRIDEIFKTDAVTKIFKFLNIK